jgi:disease resistance protein RPM1
LKACLKQWGGYKTWKFDALHAKLSYLPNSVVKLQKLRYLYVFTASSSEIEIEGGIKVPNGIQHLAGLWALQFVGASPEFLREVGALTELRTFGVGNEVSEHSADLINAITKMCHLVRLRIAAEAEDEVLRLEGLSWLSLGGQLHKTSMPQLFSSWPQLNSLIRLQLAFSSIDEGIFLLGHF